MFVDCHLTCGHENFQCHLFILAATVTSPLRRILTVVPITTLTSLANLVDLMVMTVT